MSMDWTPEQIAAAALAVTPVYCRHHGKHAPCVLCLAEARDIAEGVLSAVDLSDHDRAVAADAVEAYKMEQRAGFVACTVGSYHDGKDPRCDCMEANND